MATSTKLNEDALCRILAERMRESTQFRDWILSQTKFRGRAARLLHEEQVLSRPKVKPENWWRHWWRKIPDLSRERETDIFLVFEDSANGDRFALHIENKQDAKFTPGQAEDYEPRARWMMRTPRYLSYTDFQTVLIAPKKLREKDPRASLFHCFVSYEDISHHIPEFERTMVIA
jgi:hypothetical protein